jgi:hypothetical protein
LYRGFRSFSGYFLLWKGSGALFAQLIYVFDISFGNFILQNITILSNKKIPLNAKPEL